jgi:hypothetical protein
MKHEVIILGSQPAALVAASVLQEAGMDFHWLKGPNPAGGIFRGIHFAEKDWDTGMNLLEFTTLKEQTGGDLKSYSPRVRYDAVRFLPQIQAWLEKRIQIREVLTPEMFFQGKAWPDLLIANQPHFFQGLTDEIRQEILSQTHKDAAEEGYHARWKHSHPERFESVSYREVAYANHGDWLQKHVIEPWLEKIAGSNGKAIPALYHRQAWAPLFYPETIRQFILDPTHRLPPTTFAYPYGESFGAWMRREEETLQTNIDASAWKSVASTPRGWTITTETHTYQCRHLAYAGDLNQFMALTGSPGAASMPRVKLGFTGIRIRRQDILKDISVLNVPEPEYALFRITDQTLCSGLEATHHDLLGEFSLFPPDETEVRTLLEKSGWIRKGSKLDFLGILGPVSAFVIPEFENLKIFRNLQREIESHFPGLITMGSAAELTSVSLNDQIVQGLQLPYRL